MIVMEILMVAIATVAWVWFFNWLMGAWNPPSVDEPARVKVRSDGCDCPRCRQ